ncbi:hypothetical protein BaRGS_00006048 [Batillaria attramentaria]|uniref:Diphthine--ammonia ligase n=1 Tax=Batillaria attramentaria TaxID=370345 RepID=A0ABD0LUC3_9CAEN
MKTVALISGGKDSCFNMMHCVAEGHEIVALANLKPKDKDELDSYMYQTVGHQAIELYAEAMGLPLYRHTIQGTAVSTERDYLPLEGDEVEDLYQLLVRVKSELEVEAVAVGAILSDYQRVRVENVCLRLGLTPLAYLWRREQAPLLQEMVDCGMEAIIIKVAAMGLEPDRHLGLSLRQILPHMLKMQQKYGLNVCGEGGEYETFTLDCPLFKKRIIVDEQETVIHSADAFAPVGYIRFKKLHLEDKDDPRCAQDRIKDLPLTTSHTLMEAFKADIGSVDVASSAMYDPPVPMMEPVTEGVSPCCHSKECYFSVGGVTALSDNVLEISTRQAMDTLKGEVERLGRTLSEVFSMCLYVKKMADFAGVNAVYKTYFGINPPVRICVETVLPENVLFLLDAQGWRRGTGDGDHERRTMHVQGLSHWAPANIGPYSQATVVDGRVYVAGQIPLVPGSMTLVSGDIIVQSRLALQHVASVLGALCPGVAVPDALLAICYTVHPQFVTAARQQWNTPSHHSLTEFVVVPGLPRGAAVEWQVYAPASCMNVTAFVDKCRDSFDCDEAVTSCLECYAEMLDKIDRDWSDVPLLRVFFPAKLCSYQSLFTSLSSSLQRKSGAVVTFSLVPVIQLSDDMKLMSMCH